MSSKLFFSASFAGAAFISFSPNIEDYVLRKFPDLLWGLPKEKYSVETQFVARPVFTDIIRSAPPFIQLCSSKGSIAVFSGFKGSGILQCTRSALNPLIEFDWNKMTRYQIKDVLSELNSVACKVCSCDIFLITLSLLMVIRPQLFFAF